MSKTKHLDTAISILKGTAGSKRARGTTFTLYLSPCRFETGGLGWEGLLQGPRGKTVATITGAEQTEVETKAREHVARVPGATLTVYK
jgi:hypothetical protein